MLLRLTACQRVLLQVAVLIHSAISSGNAPLTGNDLAAVAEGLKVLLLLSTCMAAKGEAAQVRCCRCQLCVCMGCLLAASC